LGGIWKNDDLGSKFGVVESANQGHRSAGGFNNQERGKHEATPLPGWGYLTKIS
jgi:hypothetical protein